MKRFGLLMLVLLVVSAPAFGREPVGDISVYADAAGSSCNITDNGGLLQIHLVHKFRAGEGATGCRFMVQPPAGSNWSYIAFSTTFTAVGQPNSDVSLGYGPCQTTDVDLGTILYTSITPSPACGYINILPGLPGTVIATDCIFGQHLLDHGQGIANPNGTCQCTIATEPTSWGRVKALYR